MNIRQYMPGNIMLAPMAGYTDSAYRSICVKYGCAMTVTEMVSSKALVMGNVNTHHLLVREDNDTHCALQIFGHEPLVMADSIQLEDTIGFDVIDINMGCPVRKIVSNGDGSALLDNMPLASKIIQTVKDKCGSRLLTVKVRLGASDSSNVVDFARMCSDSGADMLTVHFRTRVQMYSGHADYTALPRICQAVDIPVIANGDVDSIDTYHYLTQQCGAYGVAIGRGALGRPYLFAELQGRPYSYSVLDTIVSHINMLLHYRPDHVVASEMKKHIAYYLKGLRNSKNILTAINSVKSTQQILHILQQQGDLS